jgi:hypothetical protein
MIFVKRRKEEGIGPVRDDNLENFPEEEWPSEPDPLLKPF